MQMQHEDSKTCPLNFEGWFITGDGRQITQGEPQIERLSMTQRGTPSF